MVRRSPKFRQHHHDDTDSDGAENIKEATEVRNAIKTARSIRLFFDKPRPIQIDDVLWFICFFLTMFMLDVPSIVLFNHKIDWLYLTSSGVSVILTHVIAILYKLSHFNNQKQGHFYGFLLALTGFIISSFFFCLATWTLYGLWSIFICFVTIMTYIAFISII